MALSSSQPGVCAVSNICLCDCAGVSWRSRLLELLDERDVVALQQDLADIAPLLWCVLLRERDFDSVVDNEVHEFVETLHNY